MPAPFHIFLILIITYKSANERHFIFFFYNFFEEVKFEFPSLNCGKDLARDENLFTKVNFVSTSREFFNATLKLAHYFFIIKKSIGLS